MQRRALLAAGAAAGLGLSAVGTGCAPKASSSNSTGSGGEITLNFWTWRGGDDKQSYDALFELYTAKNPKVKINYRGYTSAEYAQVLATGLAGSEGPDVCMVKQYGVLQDTIAGGGILALDDKVENLSNFDDVILDGVRGKEDGQVYGVPFAVQTMQMLYNTELFDQHGVTVPTTYQEFLAACDKLKSAGVTPITYAAQDAAVAVPLGFDTIAAARYGGREFEQAVLSGDKTFASPEFVAALQLIKDLQPYLPENASGVTGDDATILFATGKTAMLPPGTYRLSVLRQQNPSLKIDYFNMPPGEDWISQAPLTPGYIDGGYAVAKNSDHVDEAIEFANWLAGPEFGQGFADKTAQISPMKGVTINDPLMQRMKDDYESQGAPYLMLVDFRYGQPWGTDLLGAAIQNLLLDKADAQAAAESIDKGLASWFEPGQS